MVFSALVKFRSIDQDVSSSPIVLDLITSPKVTVTLDPFSALPVTVNPLAFSCILIMLSDA